MLTISRYGRRHWAVYLNGELLAVTVYRKGARAVCAALESAMQVSVLPAESADGHSLAA